MSVLIPPKNCRTRSLAFIKAKIAPQIRNFEIFSSGLKSMENRITKIKDMKTCTNNKQIKHLNHALKNDEVAWLHKDKNAKGAISTNTFTNTKRIEYVNAKFIKLIDKKLFNIPSIENKLKLVC